MEGHENKVELIGYYGGDETHALSAWTSTSRELTDDKRGRMDKLLMMLGENNHGTPFEKSALHWLITSDLASHVHILKHRIASVNSESARYKELKDDKFYIPNDWDNDEQVMLVRHCEDSLKKYHECLKRLVEKGVPRKRAKESARFYLPYANQLTCDVMMNFRAFMNFTTLRNSEHAQLEIHEIARKMLQSVAETGAFRMSLDAFGWTQERILGTV